MPRRLLIAPGTRTAFDEQPAAIKDQLLANDYIAAESMYYSRKLAARVFFADIDPAKYSMGRQRLLQLYERSGRMDLYIAAQVYHIEGLREVEGSVHIEKLYNHATQD